MVSQCMESGPVHAQEPVPEQERLLMLSVTGPDLVSCSLSPVEANRAWRVTLLSLSIGRTEAL